MMIELALEIWTEQYASGVADEAPDATRIEDWIANRAYPRSLLIAAANGDVAALVEVRREAGLDVFC